MKSNQLLFLVILCSLMMHTATAQSVVINEFMADNDTLTQITDEANQYDDWIELYNTSNQAIDLSGYNLSDNGNNLDKWSFPNGTAIGPDGYLIVWADDDASQGPYHATFKLDKNGESIYLTTPNLSHVDSIEYGEQDTNISMARIPNGTGPFIQQAPTFGFNNDGTMAVNTPTNDAAFKLFPNPVVDHCFLEWYEDGAVDELTVSIYNTMGKLMNEWNVQRNGSSTHIDIPVNDLGNGAYIVHLSTTHYHSNRILTINK